MRYETIEFEPEKFVGKYVKLHHKADIMVEGKLLKIVKNKILVKLPSGSRLLFRLTNIKGRLIPWEAK